MPGRIIAGSGEAGGSGGSGAPSRAAIYRTFLKVGLCGFGGVGPWARRIIVEERAWLTEREYAELLGLCQVLPGPNVGNVSVMIGDRFHGWVGAVLAVSGLLTGPLAVLVGLVALYDRVGAVPEIDRAIGGIAAAAAGLFVGTALRMAGELRLAPAGLAIAGAAFVAIGIARLPLMLVVLALTPVSVALVWRARA